MENIIKFQPLFVGEGMLYLPHEAVQELRAEAMEVLLTKVDDLHDNIREFDRILSKEFADVAEYTMNVTRLLLSNPQVHRGPIARVLSAAGYELCGDPILLVTAMISQWFHGVSPYMTRDINIKPASDASSRLGNLGFLSMLLTLECWEPIPECASSKLRFAVLVANSVTTVICGAYVMFRGSNPNVEVTWDKTIRSAPPSVCIWTFLKSSWQIARTGGKAWAYGGPGVQVGATSEEIRMRKDGKRLLVKIGRLTWEDPAYWHPCKQVPGSPWNKFFRNKNQPTFEPSRTVTRSQIMYRIPSTALKFIEKYEDFYDTIYEGMDRRQFARITLNMEESDLQHNRLACETGLWYPDAELEEEDAAEIYNAFQDYVDVVPLATRPTLDAHGQLTLPFMTSAARALRFYREPEAIEEDLWMMAMGGIEAGQVLQ